MKNARGTPWVEDEVKAAINGYLWLLEEQRSGNSVNKSELYRSLSIAHPKRSAKAFELKFQNISAILYEEKRPYAEGLMPRSNYQSLLKEILLVRLRQMPPARETPFEILLGRLKTLKQRGPIPVRQSGSGRFGLLLEYALGIPANSSKSPDFMGIELKTKRGTTHQTLFSRTPSRYLHGISKEHLVRRFGKREGPGRFRLYTSFSNKPDNTGFSLIVRPGKVVVRNKMTFLLEYDAEYLEEALQSKLSETAYIRVSAKQEEGVETCTFETVLHCKRPSIMRFLKMVGLDAVFLDFTLRFTSGTIKSHGFLWRVRQTSLRQLYGDSRVLNLA